MEGFTMAYQISDECIACGACAAECPVSAISEGDGKYVIDATPASSAALARIPAPWVRLPRRKGIKNLRCCGIGDFFTKKSKNRLTQSGKRV